MEYDDTDKPIFGRVEPNYMVCVIKHLAGVFVVSQNYSFLRTFINVETKIRQC